MIGAQLRGVIRALGVAEIQRDEQHPAKPSQNVNGLSASGERRPARRRPFLRKREKNLLARHNPVGTRFRRSADPAAPAFPWLVRAGRSCTAPERLSLPFSIDDQASVRMNCMLSLPYRALAIRSRSNGSHRTPIHANRSPPEISTAARRKPCGPYERSARSTSSAVYQVPRKKG